MFDVVRVLNNLLILLNTVLYSIFISTRLFVKPLVVYINTTLMIVPSCNNIFYVDTY